jgi:hypothetical protein
MGLPILFLVTSLFAGGIFAEEFLSEKFQKSLDSIFSVAVKLEVDGIAKLVYLDTIDESAPTSENFAHYLRREMRIRPGAGLTRDSSRDFWGTPYDLRISPKILLVTSAGPDLRFGTRDDIRSGYGLSIGDYWVRERYQTPASSRPYTPKEYSKICNAMVQHLRANGIAPKSDCAIKKTPPSRKITKNLSHLAYHSRIAY